MQMILGSKATRFQSIFLKSLFAHHFVNQNTTDPAPIHLHLLTDKATCTILKGIMGSWNVANIRVTYYAAEQYQVNHHGYISLAVYNTR